MSNLNRKPITFSIEDMDIRVSDAVKGRAMKFMSVFIEALRVKGYSLILKDWITTLVDIEGEKYKISVREKSIKVKDEVNHPTGFLFFKIMGIYGGLYKAWYEGDKKLEDYIPSIIKKLEDLSAETIEGKKRYVIYEKAKIEAESIKKEYEDRKSRDLNEFSKTLQKASRWHKSENLRKYIDTVESNGQENNTLSDELISWIQWARNKADWYDPFIEEGDELLNDIDRDDLKVKK